MAARTLRRMTSPWVLITISLLGCGSLAEPAGGAPERVGTPSAQAMGARIALVIGNNAYSGKWPELQKGPLKDAELMRETLTKLNFEIVYQTDADLRAMKQALQDFRAKLQKHPRALALVYFSGHGAQAPVPRDTGGFDIENYLIPAGSTFAKESDAAYEAIGQHRIEDIIRSVDAAAGIIIIDACRDNALEHDIRAGVRGLANTPPGATELLIEYAALSGKWSYNRANEPSVFTTVLAKELLTPGTLEDALHRVHDEVRDATRGLARGEQEPEMLSRLGSRIVLVPEAVRPDPDSANTALLNAENIYIEHLRSLQPGARASACQDYSGKVQRRELPGLLAGLARDLCASGGASPTSQSHLDSSSVVAPTQASVEPPPSQVAVGRSFRDCSICPELVMIGPGSFQMGSPPSEKGRDNDEAQHEVTIGYSFAVGKYPIKRGEWREFVKETNHPKASCDWENPGFPQDDTHPVVCITWKDATDYMEWLSRKTGHHYRLLSEAEYEYISRAGSTSPYPWGYSPSDACRYANVGEYAGCDDGYRYTSPVGKFLPNNYGLFDTTGNVWSWTQDCYHDGYSGAPTDGRAWEGVGDCQVRVRRGGSWSINDVRWLRSAARNWLNGVTNFYVGARAARTPW